MVLKRREKAEDKESAARSSSTASGNADILHKLMKIYCDGRCSITALKKAMH